MANNPITVWRLIAHHAHPDDALHWTKRENRLAIGWGLVGTLRGYASARDITEAIKVACPTWRKPHVGGICLYDFCYRMQLGDLVIISTGGGQRSLVMEVEGDYEFKPEPEPPPMGDYQHQRKASSLPIDPDSLWQKAGSGPIVGHNMRWPLFQCRQTV